MEKDTGTRPDFSHSSQPTDHTSEPTESSSDPQMLLASAGSLTQSSAKKSTHGKDVKVNCKTEGETDSTDTPLHPQPTSCDESDGEEFLSASEGEAEDDNDEDDDVMLEQWAESLSDFNTTANAVLSTEKDSVSEQREVFTYEKNEEGSSPVDTDNGVNSTPTLETHTGNKPEEFVDTSSDSNTDVSMPDKTQTASSPEVCQNSVPEKDEKVSAEDIEELEHAIAAAAEGTEEDEEASDEDGDEKNTEKEKDGNDSENKDSEDSAKQEAEEERKRQEEEDALTEGELQKRLSEAVEVKTRGNDAFKSGQYHEALELYSQALDICPLKYIHQRALMLSNRAACHNREGYYERAVKDSTKAAELDPTYIKAYFRRADAYEKLEKLEEALKDHQKVVELDRTQAASFHACVRLEKEIQERNEKLKTEMLGKLKDLGNMVLRPFGLSTNNFQLQQDPSTGSYSVQFVQQPPTNGH